MERETRGLFEAYAHDPIAADREIFGRESDPISRRGFLQKSGLLAMMAVVGSEIPFADKMPGGLIPAALASVSPDFSIPGKDGLIYLNDRPVNAETPAHLLDDPLTPASRFFIRNNGLVPDESTLNPETWTLKISGESVEKSMTFTLPELKKKFKNYTYSLHIECGGNGRSEFYPPASGNQWTVGAVGCAEWTGVRVRDVLEAVGIKKDAVYLGYKGTDVHLSGDTSKVVISRGVPMHKALEDESLIAWAMNGEPLPLYHGYPLRLVFGGWPASTSGKWLNEILIRDREHDGAKMGGQSYRIPCNPVAPGTKVPNENMCILESMPVKSIVTFPRSGAVHQLSDTLAFRGQAWGGDYEVKELYTSIDFGATWQKARVQKPKNRLAWQRWEASVKFPMKGYYEIWARAVDSRGISQPMVVPAWNPRGYANNSCHRIAVQVV